jgi:two-component system, response regulator YesN
MKLKTNIKDLNLLKFAIYNIACEILSNVYTVDAADTGENHVTLLINTISEVQNNEEETMRPYFIKIQNALLEYFKLSITVAVGCISNNAAELNNSFKATIRNFEYRIILGHQSIITYSYVTSMQEKEYVFPENMEKNMIEALKLCRKEQAEQIFFEIINLAIECGINALHSSIIRLAVAISNTAQTIKLYYDADNLTNMDINTLLGRVNQMETLNQITALFKEYFQRIIEVLDDKRSNKIIILVNNVKKYIESNYMDPNLSLKSIADLHHITPAYLGKLFKENAGVSVSEYINEIRLKVALKLLSDSSVPINDIIEKTGNTSTLFFRCFRKEYGITPNEYRKNMQKPSIN